MSAAGYSRRGGMFWKAPSRGVWGLQGSFARARSGVQRVGVRPGLARGPGVVTDGVDGRSGNAMVGTQPF